MTTTTTTPTTTTTTTSTTPTTTTSTTTSTQAECPDVNDIVEVDWIGQASKIMYMSNSRKLVRTNFATKYNTATVDKTYTGFLIYSRKTCGADFMDLAPFSPVGLTASGLRLSRSMNPRCWPR